MLSNHLKLFSFQLYSITLFYDSFPFYFYRTFPQFHSKGIWIPIVFETKEMYEFLMLLNDFHKKYMDFKTSIFWIPFKSI